MKNLCNEEETVRKFTYLSDMENEGGDCEAAVTVKTCEWGNIRECG